MGRRRGFQEGDDRSDRELLALDLEYGFDVVYRRHYARLRAILARKYGTDAAHEGVQTAFMRLFVKARSKPLEVQNVCGWLLVVAENAIKGDLKRSTRVEFHADPFEDLALAQPADDDHAEARQLLRELGVCWRSLSATDRLTIQTALRCEFEGRPQEEAAAEMGITHEVFRVRFSRARKRLRKLWGRRSDLPRED
jgi:RNA polymerase sigma factor (sigma-70 family)